MNGYLAFYKNEQAQVWACSSVLALAESESKALELARQYDESKIDRDNIFYPDCYGKVIIALSHRG